MKQSCLLCLDSCSTVLALCNDCQNILPWQQNTCAQCAIPLPNTSTKICGQCIASPPAFQRSICLFSYKTPIQQIIRKMKFHDQVSLTKLLGKLWIQYLLKNNTALPDCILPVPLHPKRLKSRGFNQALEIAKPIGKYFKIPIDTTSCIKIKNTKAQSSLTAKKRRHNMKNAFALSQHIKYKHVVIIDDVMTTGQTISEIANLLKLNGVEKIEAWCCARA